MKTKAAFLLIALVGVIMVPCTRGQETFERSYGGSGVDLGRSIIQNDDGDYLIAGYTDSYGTGGDAYLLKIDSAGDLVWQNNYGGSDQETGFSLCPTSDGGYLIAGITLSYGMGGADVYIQKTDGSGNPSWHSEYGGTGFDWGLAMSPTTGDRFMIGGHTTSFGVVGSDGYILEIDSAGDSLWAHTYEYTGSQVNEEFYGGTCTSDGGFIATGIYMTWPPSAYVVKTDSMGVVEWQHIYSNTDWGRANCIIETAPGEYAATGVWGAMFETPYICLVKLDSDGDIVSHYTYGDQSEQSGQSLALLPDGGFIIGGFVLSSAGYDAVLLKTDSNGNQLWMRYFGGDDNESPFSVIPTNDGGFILTGYTESYGPGDEAVYVVKTDSLGMVEPTSVGENPTVPHDMDLSQNYPNPFNASTTIEFSIAESQNIQIAVYDLLGRHIKTLVNKYMRAGAHSVTFDASEFSSGVYFYRLQAGETAETRRMVLLK